jgi:hypothetical protein
MRYALGVAIVLFSPLARAEDCPHLRPTDATALGGYVYEGTPASFPTPEGNVRVWWTPTGTHAPPLASTRMDGTPDVVVTIGTVLEESIAGFKKLGFKPALRDGDYAACASNGGDDRLDIYLVAFKGADGQAATDRCTTAGCSGFMFVDKNFVARGYKTTREGAETVAAHEYFHLVQYAYGKDMDRFWSEGTAQWATKQVFPEIVDLERFLPDFFDSTARPLDTPPTGVTAGYLYGSAIFPQYLGEKHGIDVVVRAMEAFAAGKTPALVAVDDALTGKGTSLADDFITFASWNAATGSRAGQGTYKNAAKYPMVPASEFADGVDAKVEDITAGFGARYYALHDPTPRTIALDADGERLGGVALPLVDGKVALDKSAALPARVEGEAIVVLAGRSSKKTDVRFTLRAEAIAEPPKPQPGEPEAKSGCATGRTTTAPWWLAAILFARAARARRPRGRPSR